MTDHATNAANLENAITCELLPELDSLIDTGGGGSDFSWKDNPTQVIYDFISRHRPARERELEKALESAKSYFNLIHHRCVGTMNGMRVQITTEDAMQCITAALAGRNEQGSKSTADLREKPSAADRGAFLNSASAHDSPPTDAGECDMPVTGGEMLEACLPSSPTKEADLAAREIRSHIREFGANAGMSAHSLGVITDIIRRHLDERVRELERELEASDRSAKQTEESLTEQLTLARRKEQE